MKWRLLIGILSLIGVFAAMKYLPDFKRSATRSAGNQAVEEPLIGTKHGDSINIDWRILRELNLDSGLPSARLGELQGRQVRIPGFVVPLEDAIKRVSEFLFVPTFQACIHVPPPPPNQMIYVKMKEPFEMDWNFRAFWLEGILRIQLKMSAYGAVSYEMEGLKVTPYKKD